MTATANHEIIIVGAGFSGIGTAIKLDEAGLSDYLIVDDGNGAGGTWNWNTYPGVQVDIPSFSYQFSFEKSADWSRTYAHGAELKAYADRCVDKYRLRERMRFNTRIADATFDEEHHLWQLTTTDGDELTCRFLVNATGVFSQPSMPDIKGIDGFTGTILHTARWDHTQDLFGKRVGVIGTGASAVQVVPSIAPDVASLTVFQRTPIWCVPKYDLALNRRTKWALRRLPLVERVTRYLSQAYVEAILPLAVHFHTLFPFTRYAERVSRRMLAEQVNDPGVRDKLTPRYAFGCKRPAFTNDYWPAFNRDNVHLETASITESTPTAIRTADGGEHEIDVLILATGFSVFGTNGLSFTTTGVGGVDLGEWWNENRFQSYEGVSVPGFPNLFSIFGPYGYNGSSYFTLIETQAQHAVRCLAHARAQEATCVEVDSAASRKYFTTTLRRQRRQVFWQESCKTANSYYFTKGGDVPLRPATTPETYWRSKHFDLSHYRYMRLPAAVPATAA
jgi:cyclohexanone monooxygenase